MSDSEPDASEVTRILSAIRNGDAQAAKELLPLVYEELRRLAAFKMAHEPPGQTLQATALVHEAWLRLGGQENQAWNGRSHFFGAAAEAMRRILIDNARRKRTLRHGGGQQRMDVQEMEIAAAVKDDDLLEVNAALERFAAQDKQKAELVKLRYFTGLTIDEAAEILGVSAPTAKRWWAYARAWLHKEIEDQKNGRRLSWLGSEHSSGRNEGWVDCSDHGERLAECGLFRFLIRSAGEFRLLDEMIRSRNHENCLAYYDNHCQQSFDRR